MLKDQHACPTCGGPVVVAGEGLTHWYQPAPPPVIDVVRLNVQPGEVLAIRLPVGVPRVERDKVKAWFDHHMPGVAVLLVSNEVAFAAISVEAAQTEARP